MGRQRVTDSKDKPVLYGLALLLLFAACADEKPQPLSVQVVPARLLGDARGPEYASWDTVEFVDTNRNSTATYLVAPEPLLTEWNIIACKIADSGNGTQIIAARLNAYGSQKMQKFGESPANLKQPLGLKIGERWANFSPLLNQVQDRIQLRGFTAAEAEQLQHDIANR